MASDQPSSTDSEGTILRQKTPDWKPGPVYVDWEDVLEALEQLRKLNVHGYGYLEAVAKAEGSGDDSGGGSGDPDSGGGSGDPGSSDPGSTDPGASGSSADDSDDDSADARQPWLNQPFADPDTSQSLGAGTGILLPFTLAWDGGLKMLGRDQTGARRTHEVVATFNALAVALAHGRQEAGGGAMPALKEGRLAREHYRRWLGYDDDVPAEGAVSALVLGNIGVWINADCVRRGDVLQIVWQDGRTHAVYCWDVHSDGQSLFLQIVSSQPGTAGVGVPLAPESLTALGKLEPVGRNGGVEQHPVWRPNDGGGDWLTSSDARDFYRTHGFWLNKAGEGGTVGRSIKDVYVGRFHRIFPRFPLALGGSNLVSSPNPDRMPADAPDDGHATVPPARLRDSSVDLYYENNEGPNQVPRQGGFFPVSASRSWHGGVHLYPDGPDDVTAPIDGVILAARLTTADNGCSIGDTGMVLVKTKLKVAGNDIEFFTLLAHLDAPEPGARALPWLDEILSVPPDDDPRWSAGLDATKRWYTVLPARSGADDRAGADSPDGGLFVFDKRDRSLAPGPSTILVGAVVEATSRQDEHGWAKVKTQDGSVEGWVYATGRLDAVDLTNLDTKRKDKRTKLLAGEVVDLSDLDRPIVVRAGEVVGHAGLVGGDHGVHFEVFSKDLIQAYGKTKVDVEDTDHGLYTDRAKFEEAFFSKFDQTDEGGQGKDTSVQHFMIDSPTRPEDDLVLAEEICSFFARSSLRDRMRTLITRHHSEWGDAIDWSALDSSDQWKHISDDAKQSFKDDIAKLQWWKGSFLPDQGLPDDQIVHHYHPITFLAWLDAQREADDTGELHASLFELNHGAPASSAAPPAADADPAPEDDSAPAQDDPAAATNPPPEGAALDVGTAGPTSKFQITILDEVGDAVDGIDLVFTQGSSTEAVTTDASGVGSWNAPTADSVAANFASLDALRAKLADRWATPRDAKVPDGAKTLELKADLTTADDVSLTAGATDATLYVTPPVSDLYECVCIPGGTFDFDSSFLRPDVADHLKKIDDVLGAHPDGKLFVTGHTDRVGSQQYNKNLADRRAYSTYSFLTNDSAAWEQLYVYEHWGLKVVQTILQDLGHDPGNTDGVMTSATTQAMHDFLGDGGDSSTPVPNDADFRSKVFTAYMTGKHAAALTESQFVTIHFTGCGEFNPVAAPNAAELSNTAPGNEANRRVVVYVFRPEAAPTPPCAIRDMAPCQAQMATPGKSFACAFYDKIATQCHCESVTPPPPPPTPTPDSDEKGKLDVRVLKNGDPSTPFGGARVSIRNLTTGKSVGTFVSADSGWAAGLKLPPGQYSVVVVSQSPDWSDGTGHVDLPAGKTRGVMVPLSPRSVPAPDEFGHILVKTTKNGQPFDTKDVQFAGPIGSPDKISFPVFTTNGQELHPVSPGTWRIMCPSLSRNVFLIDVAAGQTVEVDFDGKDAPIPPVEPGYAIAWNKLFDDAFPVCHTNFMFLYMINSLRKGSPPWPGVSGWPSWDLKASENILQCMLDGVQGTVEGMDAQHPDEKPKAGLTKSHLQEWRSKNQAELDGIDANAK